MPDPAPPRVLTVEKLPDDWASKTTDERLVWLETQPLPSDNTISLASCYKHAADLTQYFKLIYNVIAKIQSDLVPKLERKSPKLKEYLRDFVKAFNAGIGKFAHSIFLSNQHLLQHGSYPDGVPVSTLVDVGELPELETAKVDGWFANVLVALRLTVAKFPALAIVRQGMTVSYAQLFEAFVFAGERFIKEWQKPDTPEEGKEPVENVPHKGTPSEDVPDEGEEEDEVVLIEPPVLPPPYAEAVQKGLVLGQPPAPAYTKPDLLEALAASAVASA